MCQAVVLAMWQILGQYCRQLEHGELPNCGTGAFIDCSAGERACGFWLAIARRVWQPIQSRIDQQDSVWKRSLASLLDEEYLIHTDSRLALTDKGRQFADMVGQELL